MKGNPIRSEHVRQMKERILDRTLVLIAVFGLVINVFSTIRVFNQNLLGFTYLVQVSIVVLFVFVAVFRNKIQHKIKVLLVILLMSGILISAFNAFGYLAPAKVYIPVISLFVAFVYTTKYAVGSLISFMLIYVAFGALHTFGYISHKVNPVTYISSLSGWLVDFSVIVLSGVGMLIIGKRYDKSLTKSHLELEDYKGQLEKRVGEKTSSLNDAVKELKEKNEELKATLEDLKSTQNQLVDSEKMASLGVLTAGVAHEINNPLNFIQGGYTGLKSKLSEYSDPLDEETQEYLNCIQEGLERSQVIISGLLDYSRKTPDLNERCDINSILENCILFIEGKFKENVIITRSLQAPKSSLIGNVGRLHQALLNIISNACQAIVEKGEVVVKTSTEDGKLVVIISDNGEGIPNDRINKIFDPFFTTKQPGKGTGLGLSISQNIIKEHNGVMTINSEVGKGSEVKLLFK